MNYIDIIEKLPNTIIIKEKVSKNLEITKYLIKHPMNPVFFEDLDGYYAVGNIWADRKNISHVLNNSDLLKSMLYAIENPMDYEISESFPFQSTGDLNLKDLPVPKYFEGDGSSYFTSAIIFSEYRGKRNVSFHRMMVMDERRAAIRLVPRDLYKMYNDAKSHGEELKIGIVVGAFPTFLLSAATSVDYITDESKIASALKYKTMGQREKMVRLSNNIFVPLESEYIFEAKITLDLCPVEGPFLDITRTYDIKYDQPVVYFEKMHYRKNSVFHVLLSGFYEHYNLMGMPREPTIFKAVRDKGIDVLDVRLTYGGSSWLHGVVKIRKRNENDGKMAIDAAFEGHRSMKHVFVVDEDIDINNSEEIEWSIATRFQGDRDLVMKKEKGSSLDPSRYENDITTKLGFDATIKGNKKEFLKVY
ncbi:MAG: UbiD family decarboxylase [Thermoplasmata archaeon]